MYFYILREDCYYIDIDFVVFGYLLFNEEIFFVLGKFKLEDRIIKGYFLVLKVYFYILIEGKNVFKYKGLVKNLIMLEWFEV